MLRIRKWLVAVGVLVLSLPGAPSVAAEPTGCGFGQGGQNAATICWLDMAQFDQALAATPAGQPITIRLSPLYQISFVIRVVPGAGGVRTMTPVRFPTYSGTPIGNSVYLNTPGKPALYQEIGAAGGDQGTVVLEDITVTADAGDAIDGYGFVMADAETTNRDEALVFSSDQALKELDQVAPPGYDPPCGAELSGLGTSSVTCKGVVAPKVGDLLVYALAPKQVSISITTRNARTRQGIAFGVLVANVRMTKKIGSRNGDDSFGLRVTDSGGHVVASADTGTADAADTGVTRVLTGVPSSEFSFAEVPGPGTDLADYIAAWTCEDNGVAVATGGSRSRRTVAVKVGSDIVCAVTNRARPRPELVVAKTAQPRSVRPGGRIAYTFRVSNIGGAAAKGVEATDDLSKALAGARYNGDATASRGAVSAALPELVWSGDLAAGQSATVHYSMTVRKPYPRQAPRVLRNVVVVEAARTNCAAGSHDARCRAKTSTPLRRGAEKGLVSRTRPPTR
ncbi:CshA/CshB family fibrillar adhesin-related protein [Nonomuraea sp. NPDC050556]|uniref:CshA/CshB family fibrillar adhesin-related protein n=1 Tax=Nonomuraea sp. NPDC050556 TaxID=3364369 RepID=UPI0037A27760